MKTGKTLVGLLTTAIILATPTRQIANTNIPEEIIQEETALETTLYEEKAQFQIPKYLLTVAKTGMCSKFARLMAESNGDQITPAHAWNLHKYNPNMPYDSCKLESGDVVTFVNLSSVNYRPWRRANHAAYFLGENENGRPIFAHQMGSYETISSIDELKSVGYTPKDIIIPEKTQINQ